MTAASPMMTATATKARAMSDWSGVRVSRWPFACERIWFANVSAPTASTSYRATPLRTALPDRTSSPAALSEARDSPVRTDSSSDALSGPTIRPSTWISSPRLATTMSPRTTSAGGIVRSTPSRTTVAGAWLSRATRSSWRLAREPWTTPIAMLPKTGTPVISASVTAPKLISAADTRSSGPLISG